MARLEAVYDLRDRMSTKLERMYQSASRLERKLHDLDREVQRKQSDFDKLAGSLEKVDKRTRALETSVTRLGRQRATPTIDVRGLREATTNITTALTELRALGATTARPRIEPTGLAELTRDIALARTAMAAPMGAPGAGPMAYRGGPQRAGGGRGGVGVDVGPLNVGRGAMGGLLGAGLLFGPPVVQALGAGLAAGGGAAGAAGVGFGGAMLGASSLYAAGGTAALGAKPIAAQMKAAEQARERLREIGVERGAGRMTAAEAERERAKAMKDVSEAAIDASRSWERYTKARDRTFAQGVRGQQQFELMNRAISFQAETGLPMLAQAWDRFFPVIERNMRGTMRFFESRQGRRELEAWMRDMPEISDNMMDMLGSAARLAGGLAAGLGPTVRSLTGERGLAGWLGDKADWANSAAGMRAVGDAGEAAEPIIRSFAGVLGALGTGIIDLMEGRGGRGAVFILDHLADTSIPNLVRYMDRAAGETPQFVSVLSDLATIAGVLFGPGSAFELGIRMLADLAGAVKDTTEALGPLGPALQAAGGALLLGRFLGRRGPGGTALAGAGIGAMAGGAPGMLMGALAGGLGARALGRGRGGGQDGPNAMPLAVGAPGGGMRDAWTRYQVNRQYGGMGPTGPMGSMSRLGAAGAALGGIRPGRGALLPAGLVGMGIAGAAPGSPVAGTIGGAVTGAAGGAALGSFGGPPGMLIGAGIGAIGGGIAGFFGSRSRQQRPPSITDRLSISDRAAQIRFGQMAGRYTERRLAPGAGDDPTRLRIERRWQRPQEADPKRYKEVLQANEEINRTYEERRRTLVPILSQYDQLQRVIETSKRGEIEWTTAVRERRALREQITELAPEAGVVDPVTGRTTGVNRGLIDRLTSGIDPTKMGRQDMLRAFGRTQTGFAGGQRAQSRLIGELEGMGIAPRPMMNLRNALATGDWQQLDVLKNTISNVGGEPAAQAFERFGDAVRRNKGLLSDYTDQIKGFQPVLDRYFREPITKAVADMDREDFRQLLGGKRNELPKPLRDLFSVARDDPALRELAKRTSSSYVKAVTEQLGLNKEEVKALKDELRELYTPPTAFPTGRAGDLLRGAGDTEKPRGPRDRPPAPTPRRPRAGPPAPAGPRGTPGGLVARLANAVGGTVQNARLEGRRLAEARARGIQEGGKQVQKSARAVSQGANREMVSPGNARQANQMGARLTRKFADGLWEQRGIAQKNARLVMRGVLRSEWDDRGHTRLANRIGRTLTRKFADGIWEQREIASKNAHLIMRRVLREEWDSGRHYALARRVGAKVTTNYAEGLISKIGDVKRAAAKIAEAAMPAGGEAGGGAVGDAPPNLRQAIAKGRQMGLRLSSFLRPNDRGSLHSQGRAADLAGPPDRMAAFYDWARNKYSYVEELFYDPRGGIDKNRSIGAIGGHLDHVHIAFARGGRVQGLKRGKDSIAAKLRPDEFVVTPHGEKLLEAGQVPNGPGMLNRLATMQRPAVGLVGGGRASPAAPPSPARAAASAGDSYSFTFTGDIHVGDNDYQDTVRRLTEDLRAALRNTPRSKVEA